MKNNNKGFTLTELVAAVAILGLVTVVIGVIVKTSADTYGFISRDINLQYESQLTMSQMQEYAIDCNGFVAVGSDDKGSRLYLFNERDDGRYDGYLFTLSEGGELTFYTKSGFTDNFDAGSVSTYLFTGGQPMSRYVSGFTAVLSADDTSIDITIEYALGGETATAHQTIAFRNSVTDISANAPAA